MATQLPIVTFSALNLLSLNVDLGSNARATQTALNERAPCHYATILNYRATGSTTTKVPLGNAAPPAAPGSSPVAVVLIRVQESNDKAKDLPITPRLNFSYEGSTIYVYEPAGLVLNTMYDLTFIVYETV